MGEIIDLFPTVENARETAPSELRKTLMLLEALPPEDAADLTYGLFQAFIYEVRFGLGLLDLPNEIYDDDRVKTPCFDAVMEALKEASGGCFLCDPTADPNEEFDGNICLNCQLKLRTVLRYLGIKHGRLSEAVSLEENNS